MKNFEVTVRVKNNQLKQRRDELEMTQPDIAKAIGVPFSLYVAYENLTKKPVKNGEWTKAALMISEFYEVNPSVIFPDEVIAMGKPSETRKMNSADIGILSTSSQKLLDATPETEMIIAEANRELESAINESLTDKQRLVIKNRFGPNEKTLDECAKELGVGRERVRQIEDKALRILRHPVYRGTLRTYTEQE